MTAATIAPAQESAAKLPTPKLPSNPFAGKQYLGLILPLALIALWYILSTNGVFTQVQLPSPDRVVGAGIELAQRGELAKHVAISTQRVLIGFGIGAVLGLVLGSLIGLSAPVRVFVAPTIGAFFPVYTTVSAALAHVDPKLVEMARAFGLKGLRLFTTVQLPAVLPAVISGLRLALAQAWLFLVAAELLGASMGLGYLLTDSQNNGRTDRLLLAIVALAILGKITDALVGLFERWVKAKYPSN